ncbi:cytochrome c [Aliarcobacter faecis]|uniref:c-type cytochrome n=1 Tax=Aliarcobacter faecis TaxID=1564138 RepID=UPI00047DB81A|nr:cytochrome c [Aliarcobacter faecis]QKF73784.1 cytochrome c [Aliarcobacter faecis]
MRYFFILILLIGINLQASQEEGERLFKKYCWGCHHQTSLAFGPSFSEIASLRDSGQIIAHIVNPEDSYESLGYKRSAMPAFPQLNAEELQNLADYILSFKDK